MKRTYASRDWAIIKVAIDLVEFFRDPNYSVNVMLDELNDDPYGERYIRFLASKRP